MTTTLKKVRMLRDYPRNAKGKLVLFTKGAVREVDSDRGARLIADGNAEELLAGGAAAAPAKEEV
jgi:hypothetical protein